MKIAVTYDNGNVFQHFGRTEFFKVYDVEDQKVISSEIISSNGQGHGALAGVLAEQDINLLICGGIGGGAQSALSEAGIDVCAGAQGDTDEAVEAYLRGELENSGVNCDHHGHGEGHSCGEHGCGHHEETQPANSTTPDASGVDAQDEESATESEASMASDAEETTEEEAPVEEGCGGSCSSCAGCCGGQAPSFTGPNFGKLVSVHYKGTFDDGTQFDSSYDRDQPLEFICGSGKMIVGFDAAVANMKVGEIVNVHLMPEEAYGQRDPNAIIAVPIANLPGSEALNVGEQVYLTNAYGQQFPVIVVDKDDVTITFDANNEMAGKELNFTIELLSVR